MRLPAAGSLALWCAAWELIGRAGLSTIVPPFSRVVTSGLAAVATEKFAGAVLVSLRAFALGMALALLAGVPAGVLMARMRGAGRVLGVWVNVFVSAPVSALVPLLLSLIPLP